MEKITIRTALLVLQIAIFVTTGFRLVDEQEQKRLPVMLDQWSWCCRSKSSTHPTTWPPLFFYGTNSLLRSACVALVLCATIARILVLLRLKSKQKSLGPLPWAKCPGSLFVLRVEIRERKARRQKCPGSLFVLRVRKFGQGRRDGKMPWKPFRTLKG